MLTQEETVKLNALVRRGWKIAMTLACRTAGSMRLARRPVSFLSSAYLLP
jgi:hypothetical protein